MTSFDKSGFYRVEGEETHPTLRTKIVSMSCFYRPQRSWGKVVLLHVSVILFIEGSAPLHAGIHTPPFRDQAPLGADPP